MNCQSEYNQFYEIIKSQIAWLITDNSPPSLMKQLNPLRPFIMWNNNRIMRNYLLPFLTGKNSAYSNLGGSKTITDLAIQAYNKEVRQSSAQDQMDPQFVEMAIAQMKMF